MLTLASPGRWPWPWSCVTASGDGHRFDSVRHLPFQEGKYYKTSRKAWSLRGWPVVVPACQWCASGDGGCSSIYYFIVFLRVFVPRALRSLLVNHHLWSRNRCCRCVFFLSNLSLVQIRSFSSTARPIFSAPQIQLSRYTDILTLLFIRKCS